MLKNKKVKNVVVVFSAVILLFLAMSIIYMAFNLPTTFEDKFGVVKQKPTYHIALEKGIVVLVVILVILGVIIGYKKLKESDKKRYLKLESKDENESKLRYGDSVYYLKKDELK